MEVPVVFPKCPTKNYDIIYIYSSEASDERWRPFIIYNKYLKGFLLLVSNYRKAVLVTNPDQLCIEKLQNVYRRDIVRSLYYYYNLRLQQYKVQIVLSILIKFLDIYYSAVFLLRRLTQQSNYLLNNEYRVAIQYFLRGLFYFILLIEFIKGFVDYTLSFRFNQIDLTYLYNYSRFKRNL